MRIADVLAPWEFDANAPPQIVSAQRFDWYGRSARLVLLVEANGRTRLVLRFAHDDGSWTVEVPPTSASHRDWVFYTKLAGRALQPIHFTRPDVRANIDKALRWNYLCRVVCLRQRHLTWRVAVWNDGRGTLLPFESGSHTRLAPPVPFLLPLHGEIEKASRLRLFVEHHWAETGSDISFSRRWTRFESAKRWAHLFGFESWKQFNVQQELVSRLARAALWNEPVLWNKQSEIAWLVPISSNQEVRLQGQAGRVEQIQPSFRLSRWAEIFREFGPLQPDTSFECLRHFQATTDGWLISHVAPAPTAHEQLEARLELRAWAKSHLPPDVQMELKRLEF